MVMEDRLARHVRAGEGIRPWIVWGPLNEDWAPRVQGLTLFESAASRKGRAEMAEVIALAQPLLCSAPREGAEQGSAEAAFLGQTRRWTLARRPEEYLSWGEFYYGNHLGAAFLSTRVTAAQPGARQWRLRSRINCRILVALDGAVIFDSDTQPVKPINSVYDYRFSVPLGPGEHVLNVGLFRLARLTQVGMRLDLLDGELEARAPFHEGMDWESRLRLEEEIGSVRLERETYYPGDEIAAQVGLAPRDGRTLTLSLLSETEQTLRAVRVSAAGRVVLCRADEIPDGLYRLVCAWQDAAGRPLDEIHFGEPLLIAYGLYKTTPAPLLTGIEHAETRKRLALEHYADRVGWERVALLSSGIDRYVLVAIWPEVARYALGRYAEIDEQVLRETCEFIAARKDCSDFLMQGLLRLLYWDRQEPHLSPAIRALMKETVLDFKYWVDEPGDSVMYMGTENHRLLFHVAEWLAGQLYPLEEFTNSRQRGLYHATKARMYITEWLRQRGRFAFDEWHSNCYWVADVAPLINVYDFAIAEDYKLRQMAGALLDYMSFTLAADTFGGLFGTAHSRSYGVYLKYPDFETTAAACWVLYGTGALTINCLGGMGPVMLATTSYAPPALLRKMALDKTAVVESRQRQGLSAGPARHADFVVFRTPDYMLSAVQDYRKGELEGGAHIAQVTLLGKCVLFWSAPQTSLEGPGLRPGYFSGNASAPRAVQYRNVLALTFRLNEFTWMSHCWFEPARYDELRREGNWLFARSGKGYVGVYSEHGIKPGEWGQYAGRELVCEARENTWLVECGREADWGSFDAFVRALSAALIESRDGALTYQSPSIGRFVTGWEVTPTLNGQPIQLHGYALLDSPWGQSRYGSGEMTLRYGDEEYTIWFNQ
jgi:hypothetical protein